MNRAAQALVLTAIGAVALRVGLTDEYANYVNAWMRWPLVVSGLLLVVLALTAAFDSDDDRHPTTVAAWALLIPIVVAFVVRPPALGGYVAERRVNDIAAASYDDPAVAPLAEGVTHDLLVSEFVALAALYGEAIEDRDVRLLGFVTSDGDGWYVTRLSIRCCAADASAYRVRVDAAEETAPADDQWVEVTGTWVTGTGVGTDGDEEPALAAAEVRSVPEPKRQYE